MFKIYGNSFLTCMAYYASSPNQAANWAELTGQSKDVVKAVRDAAKLKRDKGEEYFLSKFEPFDRDAFYENDISYSNICVQVKISRLYEKRNLNSAEYNQVASDIQNLLQQYGLECKIDLVRSHPQVKSTLVREK